MKHIKLSIFSLIISSLTITLFCNGYKGPLLFIPTLIGIFTAVMAYTYNAAAIINIIAGFYIVGINSLIIFILTDNALIPFGLILVYAISHFKLRFARFNYTSLLLVEPVISIVGIALIIIGGIQSNISWDLWLFPIFPAYLFFIINMVNYYDRSKLKSVPKNYRSIGEEAYEFALSDQNGEIIKLSQFRGKIILLVFVRGDWCPGCHIMLRTYEKQREILLKMGVTLLCIGPDPVGVNKEMATKIGVNYHILADPDQSVAIHYTVELQEPMPNVSKDYKGIPLPAAFLIDQKGIIRHSSSSEKAGEILNPHLLIETLKGL